MNNNTKKVNEKKIVRTTTVKRLTPVSSSPVSNLIYNTRVFANKHIVVPKSANA